MPTPTTIDLNALLAPIAGADPAGAKLEFDVKKKLDEHREEVDPDQLDPNDPRRGEMKKKDANWRGIVDVATKALTQSSKDLYLAARLTEALVQTQGFAGARDGIKLLRGLVANCWDRMWPKIEDADDVEFRLGYFNWLDDPVRGAFFPNKLRSVPFQTNGATILSWSDWNESRDPKKGTQETREELEKAIQSMSRERCQVLFDDLTEAMDELAGLTMVLNEKIEDAPGLNEVRKALDDCRLLAGNLLRKKGGGTDDSGPTAESTSEGPTAGGGLFMPGQTIRSRSEAYAQIAKIADLLDQLEPHSPIPFLLRRAVELGPKRFPELVEELTKDQKVLDFLKGLAAGSPPAASARSE